MSSLRVPFHNTIMIRSIAVACLFFICVVAASTTNIKYTIPHYENNGDQPLLLHHMPCDVLVQQFETFTNTKWTCAPHVIMKDDRDELIIQLATHGCFSNIFDHTFYGFEYAKTEINIQCTYSKHNRKLLM